MDNSQYIRVWRSYQSFYHIGSVKKHGVSSYSEISLGTNEELTFRTFGKFSSIKTLPKDAWEILEWDNRKFLFLEGKKAFEIITFDEDDVVLQDTVTAEKIFYVKLDEWNNRMDPVNLTDEGVYITIWSPSLINRITIEE
jgi:hypothetical protein